MDLTPEEKSRTVISTRVLDASIDTVFDAYAKPMPNLCQTYANPLKIVRWWGPTGFTLTTASIDLKEGRHWHFVFKGPDGAEYKNHLVFSQIERPHLFVVDHLSGPKCHGAVTFDDLHGQTRVTMDWTFEDAKVIAAIKETVIAGNEGNFDRLGEVGAGRR